MRTVLISLLTLCDLFEEFAFEIGSHFQREPSDYYARSPMELWWLHERVLEEGWNRMILQVRTTEWGAMRALAAAFGQQKPGASADDLPSWDSLKRRYKKHEMDEESESFFEKIARANKTPKFW